jgi:hypothetical protein
MIPMPCFFLWLQVSERARRQQRELEAAAYNQRQVRQRQRTRKATTKQTCLSETCETSVLGVSAQ